MQFRMVSLLVQPYVIRMFVLALIMGAASISIASTGPWSTSKFEYVARKKDVREVLREFAATQGFSVEISEGVEGRITGEFSMEPTQLLDMLAANYSFAWRVGGSVLYITQAQRPTGEDLQLRLSTVDQLKATMESLNAKNGAAGNGAASNGMTEQNAINGSMEKALVTTASVQPLPAFKPISRWAVKETDKTLSVTFARWAKEAGWKLLWESSSDYSIDSDAMIESSFEGAIETVAKTLVNSDTPMKVFLYEGNKVVRVLTKGVQ